MHVHKRRLLFVIAAILIPTLISPWYRYYVTSHIITMRVTAMETLEDCNPGFGPMLEYDGSGLGAYGGKFTSDAAALLGNCGGVQTEFGAYHLVGSYLFWGPNQSRSTLFNTLKVGCTYDLRIVGPGSRQDQKRPTELIRKQSIWAIEKQISCL